MAATDEPLYLEWLNVITNSRLIFNTLDELEDYLDNHNIRTNGVKRCYRNKQLARATFYDLYMYVEKASNSVLDLEITMKQYKKASDFYQKKLSRKKAPDKVAKDILKYFYPCWEEERYTKSMLNILEEIEEKNIRIEILVLLLMKAWPSYESKDGDINNFDETYNCVIRLMDDFTKDTGYFESMPTITEALEEQHKTRLTLLNHVKLILSSYSDFASPDTIFDLTQCVKEDHVDLDIEGYWNECGGRMERTDFWRIEKTTDAGMYFLTKYIKKQNNIVEKMRYGLEIIKVNTGLLVYLLHPKAPKHLFGGQPYDEGDHCYYHMDKPKDWDDVTELNLTKSINYKGWANKIILTKVTDERLVEDYQSIVDNCTIANKYAEWEYDFLLNLHAITQDAIYITTADGDKFYKLPIDMRESFSKLTIDSRVGLIVMGNMTYIAFDEFMIYIPVKKIKRYGIEVVDRVE